jgi:uncharacterized hydrophobic protein (TIGR00271 family)
MKFNKGTLLNRAREEIRTDSDLIILTIISALLAGFAIYMDNLPLLIGSMLIGPFFDPILSLVVLGLLGRKKARAIHALGTLLFMITIGIVAVVFQFLIISNVTDFTMLEITNIGHLESFLVALLLGAVGMLLWIWPKASNTSAGVSIAIFLVPPLANVAIGLVYGGILNVLHYASLFILNCLGMVLGGYIILKFLIEKNNK